MITDETIIFGILGYLLGMLTVLGAISHFDKR